MSVFEYTKDGQSYWRFYLVIRSKLDPRIRLQRRAAGFSSAKDAEQAERKLIVQLSYELTRRENMGLTWEDVIHKWQSFHELYPSVRYARATVVDYPAMLRKYTAHWLKRTASELNRGDGRILIKQLEDMGKQSGFQKKMKVAINIIYQWGIDEGLITGVHCSPIKGVETTRKTQDPLPEILTLEQVRTLLRVAKERMHPWYKVWAVTVLTGCRNGEVLGLRKEDIELVDEESAKLQLSLPPEQRSFGIIRLTRAYNLRFKTFGPLKGRYWRNVPVSSELYWILKDLKQLDNGEDRFGHLLFPHMVGWKKGEQAQILRAFCNEIGLPSIRFHTLRACFATHLISRGVPSATVMKICGWRELKTAERYIRLAGIDERGATEGLGFIPNEQGIMEKVVNMYDFKARS